MHIKTELNVCKCPGHKVVCWKCLHFHSSLNNLVEFGDIQCMSVKHTCTHTHIFMYRQMHVVSCAIEDCDLSF